MVLGCGVVTRSRDARVSNPNRGTTRESGNTRCGVLVLAAVTAEFVARRMGFVPLARFEEVFESAPDERYDVLRKNIDFLHPGVPMRFAQPVHYRTNGMGFRDDREYVVERQGDATRVMVLGGGPAFGVALPFEKSLAARLREEAPELEVINASMPGHVLLQAAAAARVYVRQFKPDYVVYLASEADTEPPINISYALRPGMVRWLSSVSAATALFLVRNSIATDLKSAKTGEPTESDNAQIAGELVDECAKHGAQLIVATYHGAFLDNFMAGLEKMGKLQGRNPALHWIRMRPAPTGDVSDGAYLEAEAQYLVRLAGYVVSTIRTGSVPPPEFGWKVSDGPPTRPNLGR